MDNPTDDDQILQALRQCAPTGHQLLGLAITVMFTVMLAEEASSPRMPFPGWFWLFHLGSSPRRHNT